METEASEPKDPEEVTVKPPMGVTPKSPPKSK